MAFRFLLKLHDSVHHQEWIPMRQRAHDLIDIEDPSGRGHWSRRHGEILGIAFHKAAGHFGVWPMARLDCNDVPAKAPAA